MKLNKGLKISSIIFECSFIGSIVLYIYNFYISNKKYEVIPATIKSRLNIFIIIAILSLIIFLIIKYILHLRNKTSKDKIPELEMKFNELNEKANIKQEDKVVERVMFYRETFDVPKERRMICPNCKCTVDRNAYICLKCGYLLKQIATEKVVEKKTLVNNKIKKEIIINVSLIIAIAICLVFIINIAIERGIIG